MNAVELMASTSVDLIRASSVDRTGKEVMDTSDFCDSIRGSEVQYDYDTSVENNIRYPDLLDECSRERRNIPEKDLKLNSVEVSMLLFNLFNLPLPNTETVYFRLITSAWC